ncbi:glycoside hydrolase family 20 zincin-like fold domain-containing protein [Verrucomicrobiota bacterium]
MKPMLIPQPQSIKLQEGSFLCDSDGTITIPNRSLRTLTEHIPDLFGSYQTASKPKRNRNAFIIRLAKKLKPGGYKLRISSKRILLECESPSAGFHGLQTLSQLVSQKKQDKLPCLIINDWPDFPVRGIYYDVSRGRVPETKRLMEFADQLSQYKINQLQFYVEDTFRFLHHPEIGKHSSPLTKNDILRLDSFCREKYIELVPSMASFGHLSKILELSQYRHLAEDWGIGKYLSPEAEKLSASQKHKGWTLSPANPEIYIFLDSLFSEFLPLFKSDKFNVCCDETYDLGLGQSFELCKKEGVGLIYLTHILKLRELAGRYNKQIMLWGDMIRKYPELIEKLPKDITVLDWNYDHNHNFASIRDFTQTGLSAYGCPGTSSWASLFPRIHEAWKNIASASKEENAAGILTTDWGDGGHYNFMEFSWPCYLFGAEKAWNAKANQKSFLRKFCKLFLKSGSRDLQDAISRLGDITHLSVDGFYQSVWQHIFFACPGDPVFCKEKATGWISESGKIRRTEVSLNARLGANTVFELDNIRDIFSRYSRKHNVDPPGVLPYWIFAVDTLRHSARKLSAFSQHGTDTPATRRSLKSEMTKLMNQFERLWLARNRRSEIYLTLGRYRKVLQALD